MNPNDPELEPEERAAVVAEWRRLEAEPPPVNPRPYGCATFVIAAVLLALIPKLMDRLGASLPQPFGLILQTILGLALAGGFFVGVFVGSGLYGRAHARAHAALDWLAANPESRDAAERRRNAVALLFNMVVWDGPTVSQTVNVAQATTRLGTSLPYVLKVERILIAECKFPPMLTGNS